MSEQKKGISLAVLAFTFWGFMPLYYRYLNQVPVMQIVAHRIIWSALFTGILIAIRRQWPLIRAYLSEPRRLGWILLSTVLILINWFTIVYAIVQGQYLQVSLGYFINPIVNILLGFLLLKEGLSKWRWGALALASIGVGYQLVFWEGLPWVALTLAGTFGVYGYARKVTHVETLPGLFLESMLALPLGIGVLLWQVGQEASWFSGIGLGQDIALLFAGVIGATPLLVFTTAARLIPFSILGFLQYWGPTLQFILAVYWFHEPLSESKLISFLWVWLGLSLLIVELASRRFKGAS